MYVEKSTKNSPGKTHKNFPNFSFLPNIGARTFFGSFCGGQLTRGTEYRSSTASDNSNTLFVSTRPQRELLLGSDPLALPGKGTRTQRGACAVLYTTEPPTSRSFRKATNLEARRQAKGCHLWWVSCPQQAHGRGERRAQRLASGSIKRGGWWTHPAGARCPPERCPSMLSV